MNTSSMFGLILMVAGGLGLAYRGFNYTHETHRASIGTLDLSINDNRHVDVPVWASVAAIIAGGVLMGVGRRRA